MKKFVILAAAAALVVGGATIAGFAYYHQSEGYLIGVVEGDAAPWDRLSALEDLNYNKHDPQTVVPLLIKLLDDRDSEVRSRAVQYLAESGDKRAVAPLTALFNAAGDEAQAKDIGQSLAKFGADVVPVFLARLRDPKPYVRATSAAALGWVFWDVETGENKIDPDAAKAAVVADAVGPLIPMLGDADADVRGAVADAMGNIRDTKFLAPLVAALAAQTDVDLEIFSRVISSYRADAVAALSAPLRSGDVAARLTAASAMAEIADMPTYDIMAKGTPYVQAATDALDQGVARNDLAVAAGGYLHFIIAGQAAAVPVLVSALERYGDVRMATALLNSGQSSLEDAAKSWAQTHGFQITTHEEHSRSTPQWGGG